MDRNTSTSSRADALEAKKRRLEELRARRSNRGKANGVDSASATTATTSSSSSSSKGNLDDYIDGLLKQNAPGSSSILPMDADSNTTATTATTSTTTTTENNAVAPTPVAKKEDKDQQSEAVTAEQQPVVVVEEAPKKITFTMGTQTDEVPDDETPKDATTTTTKSDDEEQSPTTEEEEETKEEAAVTVVSRVLTEDQANETLASEPFSTFFVSASKKVERLLGTPILADLLDYSSPTSTTTEDDDATTSQQQPKQKSQKCVLPNAHVEFECSKWTSTRDCTHIDWSPIHRELMLASYHTPTNTNSTNTSSTSQSMALSSLRPQLDTPSASLLPRSGELQSDGLALVWSLAMPNRPEHIFTCASPVMTSKFHPTEHHLVIGGCQSGQLVVWDIRAGRLPVQRSALPTLVTEFQTHAHPICSMEIMDSKSGLVTASTDGRLNFWSLSNLRDPAESFLFPNANISSLGVAPDTHSIVCGDENGNMHALSAGTGSGKKKNSSSSGRRTHRTFVTTEQQQQQQQHHFGMITGLSTKLSSNNNNNNNNNKAQNKQFSRGFVRGVDGLVLTSGVDWTTKLWAPAYTDQPILSFLSHSYDYMCDVQWSPVHPSVFATASSNGSLGLWNLATSIDEPISGSDGIVIDKAGSALNKIKWSLDGRRIAVASADKLHVLGLTEDVWKVKGDESSTMMSSLQSRGFLPKTTNE